MTKLEKTIQEIETMFSNRVHFVIGSMNGDISLDCKYHLDFAYTGQVIKKWNTKKEAIIDMQNIIKNKYIDDAHIRLLGK